MRKVSVLVTLALTLVSGASRVVSLPAGQAWQDASDRGSELSRGEADGQVARVLKADAFPTVPHAKFGRSGRPVRGVNLGGWFILENWENPSIFLTDDLVNKDIPDEWTWMNSISDKSDAKQRLLAHYNSWITEADFQKMAEYGLNTVRLPVPHWAFNGSSSEPYLDSIQLPWISKAIGWARDYNLDMVLDLHTVPGSQNGYDNSGRAGAIAFQNDPMNAARAIDALVKMVQWYVNDPQWKGVIKAIEVVNEPKMGQGQIPRSFLEKFYRDSYTAIRKAIDPTKAPVIPTVLLSDAFVSQSSWDNFYSDANFWASGSYAIDTHHYEAFAPLNSYSYDQHIQIACSVGPSIGPTNKKRAVVVGEFSLGIDTRCVPYKPCKGVTMEQDVRTLNKDSQNLFARKFWEAQTSTFEQYGGGWIFWNWKGESTSAWSYKDAVKQGWIPSNLDERVFKPAAGEQSCVSSQPNVPLSFNTRQDG
ncbi:glycoside hydrolase [Violaceomyces palustris]|uniref:Glycoside hydrolase n=1 Tax=Violaceomyces palustris TaxID=1673888 RepID=A0ACD0NLP3_9BASI|nr:glycoside hydrolase [Violaceomyces palustris]